MRDGLHFSYEQLTARFGDKYVTLNKALLDKQLAWHNLDKILQAHEFKLMLYEMIEEAFSTSELVELHRDLTLVEFELQKLWGFEQDINFHKFWEYPKCKCPKMDNEDRYPNGWYIRNVDCDLHAGIL